MFRSSNVGIYARTELIHTGTPAKYVPDLMQQLFTWLKESKYHPLVKSCIFHYEFEFIHPFQDGNGRTGRLRQSSILQKWKDIFTWLPVETLVYQNQEEYYKVLQSADNKGDSTEFVEFMPGMIRDALSDISTTQNENNVITNEDKALSMLKQDGKMSATMLGNSIGTTQRQAQRILSKLKDEDKIKELGGTLRMNWEDQYDKDTLRVGFMLFKNGKWKVTSRKPNSLKVEITSYPRATVTVNKEKNGVYSVKCDCWNYKYDNKCSHCVAALYAMDEPSDKQEKKTTVKQINPYTHVQEDDEYHYYDLKSIVKDIYISDQIYEEAQTLIKERNIFKKTISTFSYHNNEDGNTYTGLSIIAGLKDQDGEVKVEVGKDFFWRCNCDARKCYYSEDYSYYSATHEKAKVCKHVAATFQMLADFILEENPGDETDYRARQLLGRILRQNNSQADKIMQISLTPELLNDDGELRAGFKIGIDKKYKVKNLPDLVEKVRENETLTLGKNCVLNFGIYDFDEDSRKFYDFIQSKVRDNLQRSERIKARLGWGYPDKIVGEKITDTILLEGSALDEFYQMCQDMPEIEYAGKEHGRIVEKGKVKCCDGLPSISLVLTETKDKKQITGVKLTGDLPSVSQGNSGIYYTDGNNFYKAFTEGVEQIKTLYDLADNWNRIELTIGRRRLGDFYREVFPVLNEIAIIDDRAADKIKQYIPPQADITFYLDSIDQTLVCRAEVCYGEKVHSPMEAGKKHAFCQIYRDYAKEKQAYEAISTYFPEYDENKDQSYCEDAEACFRVYREGIDRLLTLGEVKCTDKFQNRNLRKSLGIKVGVSIESDLLNLDISSSELSSEELAEIFESYRLKKKYHVLRNGDFLDLEAEDVVLLDQIMKAGNAELKGLIGDKLRIPVYRAIYLDKLLEDHEELYGHRDRNFRKLVKDFGTIKDSDFDAPDTLAKQLRNYQVYGYKWLRMLSQYGFGGILADEMGLGKTLQMISVLLAESAAGEKTSLIVCPASLVYNWREELSRFAPSLKVEAVAGGAVERKVQIREYRKADVLITSYDLLKRDIAEFEECNFDYMVLDEAQFIKNQKSIAAKTVKIIKARHRFALTGTPIENRLSELWSIFDFLMPGFLYDYETFRREIELPVVKEKDEVASTRLKRMVAPFILRRIKEDVLKDLPGKLEEVRYGIMEEKQRHLYDAQIQRISKKIASESEEEFKKGKLEILAEITRARQLCCDPSLVVEQYRGGSAKREACMDLIKSAIDGEHRMLIFSQFTSMLDILAKDLKDNGIEYYTLTGSTPKEERIRLMKAFNEGTVPVFLISLRAGGTGLNLTGADIVIHYDPWWNLAVQNQATDRAHRIGQSKTVTVYKLIIKGSIEEKILKLQTLKKDLADEILSGGNTSLAGLSKEDLLELFN